MAVAVAAPHPAAVEAAHAVIESGGNALDAALAAAAALTVAYPHQCSVGGDLVAVVRPAGGEPQAVLSIGAAAAAVDVDALRAAGPRMPFGGAQTVTVPGVVAGWAALHALGASLPLADLLAPARSLATGGVAVSPGLHRAILGRIDGVRADPGLSALLLDDAGEPVTTLYQPALAETLDSIGRNWRSFYRGHLGHRLVAGLNRLGSPLTVGDFAAHQAEITSPLASVAEGVSWYAAPPPVQGATFLAIAGSSALLADARRAQLARDALLGDPRTGPIDLDGLLLRTTADFTPADLVKPAGDTVAVTTVDSSGTAVTLIQSVFQSFGSGLLEPDTGVVLHNRGSSFSLDPAHPGRIAPGVRPPHTLCPTVAVSGDTVVALGCQGGRSQAWILAQVAGDVLSTDDLSGVLARPRWIIGAREIDRDVPTLLLEPGTPDAATLTSTASALDLAVETTAGPHDDAGHIQVARLAAGILSAASDPRADGLAAVY
ncbi:gamma-glutamyltransferase [Actinoplanes derwentensis]|uniref:Gamma-glutamyltranspeptidase / glutathione hydrolase n=1 Tax=Actinoplanes derwentensis TaxID=113562 RepID=A0A1H1ZHA4_9ACTN|nr:gamma-glutamyltransferase [Actinoplanes derwentensis]GID82446.1 gamma-glutamyltranspeptidase [Actinoplanes derwentensis]SDT33171.1 gamma-glutamyltranspeptidase / glutathione hydrolase [Actinoplanes derwentensis]